MDDELLEILMSIHGALKRSAAALERIADALENSETSPAPNPATSLILTLGKPEPQ
jgi:hypothetical protein